MSTGARGREEPLYGRPCPPPRCECAVKRGRRPCGGVYELLPSSRSAAFLLLFLLSAAVPARPVAELSPAQRDYCRIVQVCGLKALPGHCPGGAAETDSASFDPDGSRCAEARELAARGIGPDHRTLGFRLYRFLGHEHRIVYSIPDTLPVSRARLEYLISDVPLAARLVSHYMEEAYYAEWLDGARTHFQGTKGVRLRGEARRISGSFAERRLMYLGSGTAEVAFWTLTGPAFLDFRYADLPGAKQGVAYDLKVVVFPANQLLSSIMNLRVFRNVVTGKIREVLHDITETARRLDGDQGRSALESGSWSDEERAKIRELLGIE